MMTFEMRIYDGALLDIETIADYYERQAPLLGMKFKHRVEEEITRLSYHPFIYQIAFDDVRRSLIPRFPYAIAYRVVEATVFIDGVVPTKSSPRKTMEILKNRQS